MNLLGVDISFQYIVKGAIFILAVAFDVISRDVYKRQEFTLNQQPTAPSWVFMAT